MHAKKYFFNHKCHLVLLDTQFGKNDSLDILENSREISDVPVIIFTDKQNEKAMLNAFDNGADDYIAKPFRPKALIWRIKVILKRVYKDLNILN